MGKGIKVNRLIGLAPFMLFLSSYIPLFGLIAFRQIISNIEYLKWGGITLSNLITFFRHFGMSALCLILIVIGTVGSYFVFSKVKKDSANGNNCVITEVSSMNDEALGYLATYVVPLLFQNYSDITDVFTVLVIFIIIYKLYVNSKLLLVNPIISLKYSIYCIKFEEGNFQRHAMLITPDRDILEEDKVKMYNIGYQLFYGYKR